MKLSEIISREAKVPLSAIMFLRHTNTVMSLIREYGVSIDEYTSIQQPGKPYDFHRPNAPRIEVVVVIGDGVVQGVYRVLAIVDSGTNRTVASTAFKALEDSISTKEYDARRFGLERISSICTGLPVRGWEGREITPVQRSGHLFFNKLEVPLLYDQDSRALIEDALAKQVVAALKSTSEERKQRMAISAQYPERVPVTTYVFARNPDVVAEVLLHANGHCQSCGNPAPFARRSDGSPYLEVHHKVPLAEGGADTLANAIALCPNCHRKAHYA